MKITQINTSMAYYDGVMLEIWIPGCIHQCDGCQNPELWDFGNGEDMSYYEILDKIRAKTEFVDGVVFTGGDPLWSPVQTFILANLIRDSFPELKLCLYTGFSREEIMEDDFLERTFQIFDSVITDRYEKDLPATEYAGSSNQRLWENRKV